MTIMINDNSLVIRDLTPQPKEPDFIEESTRRRILKGAPVPKRPAWCCINTWHLLLIFLTAVILGMGIAIGFILGKQSADDNNKNGDWGIPSTGELDNNTDDNLEDIEISFEPCYMGNAFIECTSGDTKIRDLPECIMGTYYDLKRNWIPKVDPFFDRTMDVDSCHPTNQALLLTSMWKQNGFLFEIDQTSLYVLASIHISLHGDNWFEQENNWLSQEPVSEWLGLTFNDAFQVVSLELPNTYATGTLAPQLGLLQSLKFLDLSENLIEGTLPDEIGAIEELRLTRNLVQGSIPETWVRSRTLRVLHLDYNGITGTLPSQIGYMRQLQELSLSGNSLSSNIPEEIGRCRSLRILELRRNLMTGLIPIEVTQLTDLQILDLSENGFDYTPMMEGLYGLTNLNELVLSSTQLSGTLSSEIGQLSRLVHLDLSLNQFEGAVCTEIGLLTKLTSLSIRFNEFGSLVPSELGKLTNLEFLDLGENILSGTIPTEFGNFLKVQDLLLAGNEFNSNSMIPSEVCNLWDIGALLNFGQDATNQQCTTDYTYGHATCPDADCCRNCPDFVFLL